MTDAEYPHELENIITRMAWERTLSQPWLFEDARQEGRIAAWEAWQKNPGNLKYARGAARNNIKSVAMGLMNMTGSKNQGQRSVVTEPTDEIPEPRSLGEAEMSPGDWAACSKDIAAEISQLTPRQQSVVLLVATDQPMNSPQRGEWHGRLKPRLAERLAHLRELVVLA